MRERQIQSSQNEPNAPHVCVGYVEEVIRCRHPTSDTRTGNWCHVLEDCPALSFISDFDFIGDLPHILLTDFNDYFYYRLFRFSLTIIFQFSLGHYVGMTSEVWSRCECQVHRCHHLLLREIRVLNSEVVVGWGRHYLLSQRFIESFFYFYFFNKFFSSLSWEGRTSSNGMTLLMFVLCSYARFLLDKTNAWTF